MVFNVREPVVNADASKRSRVDEGEWPSVCTVCGRTDWGTFETNP